MPCRTDDSMYQPSHTNSQYNALKKEADNVTRMLCAVMGMLEKTNFPIALSPDLNTIEGLNNWWKLHKEVDRKRIEKEVEKAENAISGLSQEAKDLLIQKLRG